MAIVNVHEAKTQLSRLLAAVSEGETVVIAKAGTPVAKLVGIDAHPEPQRLGFLRGYGAVPDDFDTYMGDDIAALFEGESL